MNLPLYTQYAVITALLVLAVIFLSLFLKSQLDRSTARKTLFYNAALQGKTLNEMLNGLDDLDGATADESSNPWHHQPIN